jgi:hypothetical protein
MNNRLRLAYANKALAEVNKTAAESRDYQTDPVVAYRSENCPRGPGIGLMGCVLESLSRKN